MKFRAKGWCVLAILLAVGLSACGDDEADPCEGLTDICTTVDATRCDADNEAVLTCQENTDGCLVWVQTEDCSASGEECALESGQAVCVASCTDDCTPEGATQCAGTVIQTCSEALDGCLAWVDGDDCADTGEVCDDSGDAAVCACTDACTPEGATQCDGTVIQTCSEGTDGCLDWANGDDCADAGEVCDDSGDSAVCACTDACGPENATQCNGTIIETCSVGTDGCLAWTAGVDCADTDEACDDSGDDAVCVCTDACETENATQCNGTIIQTCSVDTDGCLDWIDGYDCATDDDLCDDSGDTAICVCTNLCPTENATQCAGTVIQTCSEDTDGCLDWASGTDCAETDKVCEMVDDTATCVLPPCEDRIADGGFEGGTPNSDWTEASTNFGTPICDEAGCGTGGTDGPLSGTYWAWFGGVPDSLEESSVSQDVVLLPNSAVLSFFLMVPANSGDTDDLFEVSLDETAVFTLNAGPDADAYADWTQVILDVGDYADGTTHTLEFYSLTNGVDGTTNFFLDDVEFLSGTDCCISTCDTEDATRCNGWTLQTCTADGLGCLIWVDTTDCAANQEECQVIDATNAHCVACTDECTTVDEVRCDGAWIQTCAAGPDTCLDWTNTEDCSTLPGYCDDTGADPVCTAYTGGDECADPIVIPGLPFSIAGMAIDDYTNLASMETTTCTGYATSGKDMIFELTLEADTDIHLEVGGDYDMALYVADQCGIDLPDAACMAGSDAWGGETIDVSLSAGTYYVVVDYYVEDGPDSGAFTLTIDVQ